jgi:hypothetical protein
MDNEKPLNQFQEVHKKVKERLDRARDAREKDSEVRKEKADYEAICEGFDRA